MTNHLSKLLSSNADFSPIANTFREEFLRDEPDGVAGRKIAEAIASNDANALCVALTGWSANDLLVRAGLLADNEGVVQTDVECKKACAVTQFRVRQEGFNLETYTTGVYLVVPTSVVVTEKLLRKVFMDINNEFMNTVEGQQAWERTAHDFNWGDWAVEIPEEILNRHGVYSECPPNVKTGEIYSFTVNQDRVIGYGVEDMTDEAQKAYFDEFASDLRDLGVDFIGNKPEVFGADNHDLKKLRSDVFLEFLRDVVRDSELSPTLLESQRECAETVWETYRRMTAE